VSTQNDWIVQQEHAQAEYAMMGRRLRIWDRIAHGAAKKGDVFFNVLGQLVRVERYRIPYGEPLRHADGTINTRVSQLGASVRQTPVLGPYLLPARHKHQCIGTTPCLHVVYGKDLSNPEMKWVYY
jgi:hypothetical protein